jgi:hypothetical protein
MEFQPALLAGVAAASVWAIVKYVRDALHRKSTEDVHVKYGDVEISVTGPISHEKATEIVKHVSEVAS